VARFVSTGLPFDGIFAHSDLMAIGVLRALRKAGRTVPDDVAVVGFDDIRHAAHTEIPLTTVRQPMREMGMAAASLLLARLDGSPADERVVLPTSLVVRDSSTTAPQAPSDLDISDISGS
jgi:LacI family transcriptional regulator